jgi:hypothetical protein
MTMGGTTRVATRSFEALPCADDPGTQKASSARMTQLRAKADTTIASNACNQVEIVADVGSGSKLGLPPRGPHVRFRRVLTLVREGSPLVKLRNSA